MTPTPSRLAPRRSDDCLNQLPPDMLQVAGKSAAYSFVAGTIFTLGHVTLGLYSAIGGAVASLIDSLIRPLMNLWFSRDDREKPFSCYSVTKGLVTGILFSLLNFAVSVQLGIELEVGMIASVATFLFLSLFPSSGVTTTDYRKAQVVPIIYV